MLAASGAPLGVYRLVEIIGEGGMGVVWRARDTTLDRDVAIKLLPAEFARDPERLARFEREAKAVAALSHPGILAIYGFGEHEGCAYAVTELLHGRTLREALSDGPLDAARVTALAREIAAALGAAHDRGIVHRDLKPENVFLTSDGHVKILDFGIAARVPAAAEDAPTRTSLTRPGTLVGTVDYLSPEQVRGGAVDPRTDLFALGTMLFEMLAGRHPFRRATAAETMTAILHDEPPALPSSAGALAAIARRCLAKSPDDRFPSAQDLLAALDAGRGARPRSRAIAIAGALVAVVALAAAGTWLARDRGTAHPPSLSSIGEALSPNTDASEYFEKGLLFLRGRLDIVRAQSMLDQAIRLDPSFASARAMRALTDLIAVNEGMSNDAGLVYASEREARAIIASNPNLASGHGTLGAALLYLDRKQEAQAELETALRLNPQSQPGQAWRALLERTRGRLAASEARARGMLDAVPLFWAARLFLADALLEQGHADEARHEIGKVLEQDPGNVSAMRALARVDLYRGDVRRARATLEEIGAATHPNFRVRLAWALLLAREGRADEAVAALDGEVLKYADIALFAAAQVAEIYALCGRTREALDWLDRAARHGDERADWFRRDEFLKGLRAEPRFQLILGSLRGR